MAKLGVTLLRMRNADGWEGMTRVREYAVRSDGKQLVRLVLNGHDYGWSLMLKQLNPKIIHIDTIVIVCREQWTKEGFVPS